jgi:hypothetical protein
MKSDAAFPEAALVEASVLAMGCGSCSFMDCFTAAAVVAGMMVCRMTRDE